MENNNEAINLELEALRVVRKTVDHNYLPKNKSIASDLKSFIESFQRDIKKNGKYPLSENYYSVIQDVYIQDAIDELKKYINSKNKHKENHCFFTAITKALRGIDSIIYHLEKDLQPPEGQQ